MCNGKAIPDTFERGVFQGVLLVGIGVQRITCIYYYIFCLVLPLERKDLKLPQCQVLAE